MTVVLHPKYVNDMQLKSKQYSKLRKKCLWSSYLQRNLWKN